MSRRFGRIWALIVCFAVLAPRPARAQQAETPDALLARGVELRRTGQDQQALELFRRAFELSHSPRAEAQMGLAEQALGRWLDADQHVREAYAASGDPWIQSHRAGLDASIAVIEQHVGRLEVIGNVPGAEVLVNGQPAGTLPLARPLRLIAGSVSVEVRANGYQPAQRSLTVTAGSLARESIDLLPRAATPETTATTATTTTTTATPTENPARTTTTTTTNATVEPTAPVRVTPAPAPASGISPVVAVIGLAATVVTGGILVWSGLDTLKARDEYVADPTEARYNDGIQRQNRTNALIGTVSVLGVATLAIAVFATRWGSSTEERPGHAVRRRALPFIGATGSGFALGLDGTF